MPLAENLREQSEFDAGLLDHDAMGVLLREGCHCAFGWQNLGPITRHASRTCPLHGIARKGEEDRCAEPCVRCGGGCLKEQIAKGEA